MLRRALGLACLGIGSHWALLSILYFVVFFSRKIFIILNNENPYLPASAVIEIFFMIFGGIVLTVTVIIIIKKILSDACLDYTQKVVWLILLFLLAPITAPIYFWVKIAKSSRNIHQSS